MYLTKHPSNSIHGVDSYLSDKCCIHAGQSASLLAFEESDMWVPRIEEFNRCTGAQVRLEYLPEGEDGMADALMVSLCIPRTYYLYIYTPQPTTPHVILSIQAPTRREWIGESNSAHPEEC